MINKFSQTILVELEARKYAQGNETSGLVGWALFAENNLNIKRTSFRAPPRPTDLIEASYTKRFYVLILLSHSAVALCNDLRPYLIRPLINGHWFQSEP